MRKVLLAAIVLLFGSTAFAQDYSKVEVSINYSYMRFVPQNNNIIQSFSLNGGGGGATFFLTKMIGIKAEFEGYGSQNRAFNLNGTPFCNIDDTVHPEGGTGGTCTGNVSANLFTYNVGPEFKVRMSHFEPFVEALFGGAHSNVNGNLIQACGVDCTFNTNKSPSNNAFDFIIGGGIDIPVTPHIAIRPAEVDYVLTRFGNSFTAGNNNQSNFRYQAGVVFRF
jgi:Outer membrane protein beta-barrel domain